MGFHWKNYWTQGQGFQRDFGLLGRGAEGAAADSAFSTGLWERGFGVWAYGILRGVGVRGYRDYIGVMRVLGCLLVRWRGGSGPIG